MQEIQNMIFWKNDSVVWLIEGMWLIKAGQTKQLKQILLMQNIIYYNWRDLNTMEKKGYLSVGLVCWMALFVVKLFSVVNTAA